MLVPIRHAEAAAVRAEQFENVLAEPTLAAELECTEYVFGNQFEKLFQHCGVGAKTAGKLEQGRAGLFAQERHGLEKIGGLLAHVLQQLEMSHDLRRLECKDKVIGDLLRP